MSDLEVHLPAHRGVTGLLAKSFKFASALLHNRSDCLESGEECVTLALEGAPEGSRAEAELFVTNVLSYCEYCFETYCVPTFLALWGPY